MKSLLLALALVSVTAPLAFCGEGESVRLAGQQWAGAIKSRDAEAVVALYDPDAILYATFKNRIDNEKQLTAYFQGLLKNDAFSVRFERQNIRFLGGVTAINSGIYTFSYRDNNGQKIKVPARYTFVYVKEGGGWKIIDHHSSVLPEK